jgi:hypothetical protein
MAESGAIWETSGVGRRRPDLTGKIGKRWLVSGQLPRRNEGRFWGESLDGIRAAAQVAEAQSEVA